MDIDTLQQKIIDAKQGLINHCIKFNNHGHIPCNKDPIDVNCSVCNTKRKQFRELKTVIKMLKVELKYRKKNNIIEL